MDNMPPPGAGEDATPSLRLLQILRTYCRSLDPLGLGDLRRSMNAGRYRWLRTDLAAALTAPDLPAAWWQESVGDPADADSTPSQPEIEAAQRQLWQALFPADPFPGSRQATA